MNETMNPPRCPSPAELRAFAVGELGDAEIGRIAAHVLGREACARAGRPFDGLSDGLLRSLNGFSPCAPPAAAVPERLLRVARGAGRSSCGGSRPDVSLDTGRRLARMLSE